MGGPIRKPLHWDPSKTLDMEHLDDKRCLLHILSVYQPVQTRKSAMARTCPGCAQVGILAGSRYEHLCNSQLSLIRKDTTSGDNVSNQRRRHKPSSALSTAVTLLSQPQDRIGWKKKHLCEVKVHNIRVALPEYLPRYNYKPIRIYLFLPRCIICR